MMKVLVVFLFIFFVANPCCSANIPLPCVADSDCSEEFYCSLDMYCNPCINCEIVYKRQPPISATCARVDEDCGNCLSGYQAEEWHGQRHSMKCYKPSAEPISSEENSSNSDFPTILTIFGVSLLISFFLVMAIFVYFAKDFKRLFPVLQTTKTGIELDNRNPSAPDLPQDQARSDGINETGQLINSTQTPNIQVENNHLDGASPIGPHHRDDDTLSEASQHTVPLLENIDLGNNQEANNGLRDVLTATSEHSPTNNASQTQQLPLNEEHARLTEHLSHSDVVIAIPAETPDSRDPNEEQPRGWQRNETHESLEIFLAVGVAINNRHTKCWTKNN
ncbi:hypothetical protein GHT06_021360 [Daphnia sinensis]|uniref:TNFR-Cys domain-containing protein n=1 Tax=Daphnia sinensis TaxID=1820382 RepID=A0AAD5KJ01_9CRUS|nr:hypothetical protein GHT06_021360 [Daphnia sinensis]